MKALITGASGQLAHAFASRLAANHIPYLAPPENHLDVTDPAAINATVQSFQPTVIFNCAAYNNVDAAEGHPEVAFRVNRDAVANLAEAAAAQGARLVHFGSDFVFDGTTETPYDETDATAPLNVYGQSKLEGEAAALQNGKDNLLLRVSWVFGHGQQNFFHKLREWSHGKKSVRVVWDQISVPTYTEDIVTVSLKALEKGLSGRWHLTNNGYASRFETARVFLREIGASCTVIPVNGDTFPSPAKRPFFAAMSNRRLSEALGITIPDWEDAVMRFARTLDLEDRL